MAITWTIIVVGTLLHGMQCNADDLASITQSTVTLTTGPIKPESTSSLPTFSSTKPSTSPTQKMDNTPIATPATSLEFITPAIPHSSQDSTTLTTQATSEATSTAPTTQSLTSAHQEPLTNLTSKPNTPSASTASKDSPQTSPTTVITSETNQVTINLNKTPTTITTESGTTQLSSTQTSDVSRNSTSSFTSSPGSGSMGSQTVGTTKAQTTTTTITTHLSTSPRIDKGTSTPQNNSFGQINSTEKSIIREACEALQKIVNGNCTACFGGQGKMLTVTITIDANQKIYPDTYNTQKPDSRVTDNNTSQKDDANKGTIPDTLIAILASCGALVLILCCFAAYCTYHRRSYRKNQQHLTEELQTVENGYHDNPTLEVMEVQPEMQEKKPTLNGEFNDSWIVPIDNLLKEEIPDEEDTHL